jgi:pimeloyl-ACP methyl ester carboxylesterase
LTKEFVGKNMVQPPDNLATDLRGMSALTVDAVRGIVDIVETLHHTISSRSAPSEPVGPARTGGVSGLVYGNVRSVTGMLGETIDGALGPLGELLGEKGSSPRREALLATLNGVVGDHLVATNNPLAIAMQLRSDGRPVDATALDELLECPGSRLVILVHGAFMSDLQWQRCGHDHGAALARDLGITPLYLHYNTGRHISENGRAFADLLQETVGRLQKPVSLAIIGYSMGGLVARSACHYGAISGHSWPDVLQELVFLGTPHHGAPLERGGSLLDMLAGVNPYSAPFSRLGRMRSAGITDLRYGNVLEEDWQGRDRFAYTEDLRTPVPLPEEVRCYAIAATTSADAASPFDDLLGDGLVPLSSALGRHKEPEMTLQFPQERQCIARNLHHKDLLDDAQVYAKLLQWLAA